MRYQTTSLRYTYRFNKTKLKVSFMVCLYLIAIVSRIRLRVRLLLANGMIYFIGLLTVVVGRRDYSMSFIAILFNYVYSSNKQVMLKTHIGFPVPTIH